MTDKRKAKKRKEEYGGDSEEAVKATKDEYAVAKWLRSNVPTKKTKFLNHHVEYFTGAKAIDALLTSKWASGKAPLFTTRMEVSDFLHEMLLHKFFHRAKKVPVSEQELKGRSKKKEGERPARSGDETGKEGRDGDKSQASACEGKDSKDLKEKEKRKRKIRLDMHMEQVFLDTPDAYVWIYDPIPVHYWLAGLALVLSAIGVCMFPLWPPTVRKGVYYLSIAAAAFLVLIITLAIFRLVVFCLVWIVSLSRHHLWLLPNLTEDVGFLASFWPLYQYEYRGPCEAQTGKSKKKRKKDKCSDDEADESAPLVSAAPPAASDAAPSATAAPAAEEKSPSKEESDGAPIERTSESDSETSQRSSTEREFEMVEAGDVDTS